MESIYWVMCWACHRRCKHCYEGRFRPYVRDELAGVVREAERNAPLVMANLPPRMTYRQAVAAGPVVGEWAEHGDAGGQFLQPMVRRIGLPGPPIFRLGGVH